MNRLISVVVFFLLSTIMGCSGGGGGAIPSVPRDLSGLEGLWESECWTKGEGGVGTICYYKWDVSDSETGISYDPHSGKHLAVSHRHDSLYIFTNRIQLSTQDGDSAWGPGPLTWSYDGHVLIVQKATLGDPDYNSGAGWDKFIIEIEPSDTLGSVSYFHDYQVFTDCGWIHEIATGQGTFKRV